MTNEQDPCAIVDAKIEATLLVQHTFDFFRNCQYNTREDEELIVLMPIKMISDIFRALKVANHQMVLVDGRMPATIMGTRVIGTDSVDIATATFARPIKIPQPRNNDA